MYRISSIEIVGFRGSSSVLTIPMDLDVNFFIGRNGTGKTTLMNLLNQALSVDIVNLIQSEFESVEFKLARSKDRSRPYIKVAKKLDEDGDPVLTYEVAASARSKKHVISITMGDVRGPWMHGMHRMSWNSRRFMHHESPDDPLRIKSEIQKLIRLSWISVHRSVMTPSSEGERKFESPVDRKLHQVARDFGTYFSTLDKLAAEETDKFQQIYLLSLISPSGFEDISRLGTVNPDEEKAAIRGMFAEFNIKSSVYSAKLESFSKKMVKALANYKPGSGVPADEFLILTDTIRIHEAVKEWHALLEKRAKIYEPKDDFVSIMNELFFKKKVTIDSGNQPVFSNDEGKELSIDNLSSGEKQLFILLGETLLQRRRDCIFMADEPELSLHIDWQEQLVPSLRRINPNAQIVFATHSPDVVGAYGSHTIDLEKIA